MLADAVVDAFPAARTLNRTLHGPDASEHRYRPEPGTFTEHDGTLHVYLGEHAVPPKQDPWWVKETKA